MSTHTARPTGRGRLPGIWSLALARASVELRSFTRERDAVVFVFLYPILMLALFATVFGSEQAGSAGTGVDFARYFLPGMIATGIMLSSFQTLALAIAVERDDGTLKRLRATPLPASAYFLGKVAQVLAVATVQTAVLIAIAALAYDVPLPSEAGAWLTFAWVFVLGTATGSVLGVAFSSAVRSGRSASAVVIPVVLVLQFTSGVFFPFYSLPAWLQTAASLFPLKWLAQGLRSVFLPPEMVSLEPSGSWQLGLTAGVLAVWLVAGLVVGIRTFRWRRHDDG
ncbi:ABC transporter permease [Antribacter sp. KLBMP9083]|uniref:Transport permease protein n=1 Tax=Antribacter soli TaxID=2910976 RepID=A0AA41U8J6_9MICO|nr:ABC transporter permease [Antribacter soli]MCF4122791.1 ABC transporter permease [Antribacter soli]